jgi:tagaturonate reductase
LVPYAYLHGFRTVGESVEDPAMLAYLEKAIFEEIIPSIDFSEAELKAFADDVLERFANPFIRHELKSIALNSISKFKVRVLPTILSYRKKNKNWPVNLTMGFASLILFYRGKFHGEILPINDDSKVISFFTSVWSKPNLKQTLNEICSNVDLWGQDLTLQEGLVPMLEASIHRFIISSNP